MDADETATIEYIIENVIWAAGNGNGYLWSLEIRRSITNLGRQTPIYTAIIAVSPPVKGIKLQTSDIDITQEI